MGLGLDLVRGAVDMKNGLPAAIGGSKRIGSGAWGVGLNAGVLAQLVPERVHLAFTYRSRIKLAFDGRVDFAPPIEFAHNMRDQGGRPNNLARYHNVGRYGAAQPRLGLNLDGNLVVGRLTTRRFYSSARWDFPNTRALLSTFAGRTVGARVDHPGAGTTRARRG